MEWGINSTSLLELSPGLKSGSVLLKVFRGDRLRGGSGAAHGETAGQHDRGTEIAAPPQGRGREGLGLGRGVEGGGPPASWLGYCCITWSVD